MRYPGPLHTDGPAHSMYLQIFNGEYFGKFRGNISAIGVKLFAAAKYGHGVSRNMRLRFGAVVRAGNIFQGCFKQV
ncbi:MAG: hypothetical protein JST19_05880 [Bacteroidetes bacterium]|nr:hypothetical protein [Bacteroidota bacterium]